MIALKKKAKFDVREQKLNYFYSLNSNAGQNNINNLLTKKSLWEQNAIKSLLIYSGIIPVPVYLKDLQGSNQMW